MALALALLAGFGLAVQAFANGRLGTSLGSPACAAVANQGIGLLALGVAGVATGALKRAWRKRKSGTTFRWWHLAVCVNGAVNVTVASAAAPKVGIALLAVYLVGGQCAGGMLADRFGLTPGGRRRISLARVSGTLLALGSVALEAVGAQSRLGMGPTALAFLAGFGFPLVQAGVGQMTQLTGEPLFAGGMSFGIAGMGAIVLAGIATSVSPPHGWLAAPAPQWIGGLIGASTVVVIARTVRLLGTLRLTLCIVAGEAFGGVALDLVAPVRGEAITAATVGSVLLVLLAIWISGTSMTLRAKRGAKRGRGNVEAG
jgi:transporter family-2 protein